MTIGQRLIVETDSGPVEWRRLNQINLAWARKRLGEQVGQMDDQRLERASVAFLSHLDAIATGGPTCDLFAAFGEGEADPVDAYWQEWRDRGYGERVHLVKPSRDSVAVVLWDGQEIDVECD